MTTVLRLDMPHSNEGYRWTAGVLLSCQGTCVTAALVGCRGYGLQAEAHLAGTAAVDVPRETAARFVPSGDAGSQTAAELALLRGELAEVQAAAVHELLAGLGVAPTRILAVGVHDPGLWRFEPAGPAGYLSLCDAARLAQLSGQNIIDAFPARDLAQGGLGGPVAAMPQWLLLKDPQCSRVLLDLGRTIRMTYMPAQSTHKASSRILAFDVGPGMELLDGLTQRLTGGEHRLDPGGRLAVQGRRIGELVDHWQANSYFDRPPPRWDPRGVRPERFLTDALQMAVDSNWAVRDLLCSATHFVAEMIAATLRKRLPEDARIDEILITGGGQHNGMLLREIGRHSEVPLVRIGDLGVPSEALGPAGVALLALLHLDQVPANPTAITGADVPRVLGRLTPGSPQCWQRLLTASSASNAKVRPLRSAL